MAILFAHLAPEIEGEDIDGVKFTGGLPQRPSAGPGDRGIKGRIRRTTGVAKDPTRTVTERQALKAAMTKAVQASRHAMRAGKTEGVAKERERMTRILERDRDRARARQEGILTEKQRIQRRRARVRAIRDELGLSDADIRKITRRDIRLMGDGEFKRFADELFGRALELTMKQELKAQILWQIYDKRLQKVDNYRKAVLDLPPMKDMNVSQLRQFDEALEDFHQGDIFLTERELETVDRTDLEGIRTWREAKERLPRRLEFRLMS